MMRSQLDAFARSLLNGRGGLEFAPVFDRIFEDSYRTVQPRTAQVASILTPACDLAETPSHFFVTLDMPGVAKEDIKIEVQDHNLIVSAERRVDEAVKTSRHLSERSFGRFRRVFSLGNSVNLDKITAVYKDGVLRVALSKAEAAKPRQIEIATEDAGGVFDSSAKSEDETDQQLN